MLELGTKKNFIVKQMIMYLEGIHKKLQKNTIQFEHNKQRKFFKKYCTKTTYTCTHFEPTVWEQVCSSLQTWLSFQPSVFTDKCFFSSTHEILTFSPQWNSSCISQLRLYILPVSPMDHSMRKTRERKPVPIKSPRAVR